MFFADEDYRCYKNWLYEYADLTGCRVHAYVLMTNPVHLLVSNSKSGRGRGTDEGIGTAICSICESRVSSQWYVVGRPLPILSCARSLLICLPASVILK